MVIQVESAMKIHHRQRGAVLIVFALGLVLVALSALLYQLNAGTLKLDRNQKTALALAEAKDILIGDAVTESAIAYTGDLSNPDLGVGPFPEGSETGTAGSTDHTVIGKFPWYSLGVSTIKDGWGECLWYIVSGRFKHNPPTSELNWDTQGQIDVIDGNGNQIASNLVALIVSPGSPLTGQSRSVAVNKYCGGDYDVKHYLDTPNNLNAVSGEVNYFVGSINNREAPSDSNKKFVMANNDYYNDQFLFITVEDIFNPIMKRQDFSSQVSALLDDTLFQSMLKTVTIDVDKGASNIVCMQTLNSNNKTFCDNWKEMLLLVELSTPGQITIDMNPTGPCNRVVIFGGIKTAGQVRTSEADKDNPVNYLEGSNYTEFISKNSGLAGQLNFESDNPSGDVMRCL